MAWRPLPTTNLDLLVCLAFCLLPLLLRHLLLEVLQRSPQPLTAANFRLPAQQLSRPADVGLAHLRIVLRQWSILDRTFTPRQSENLFRELENRHFVGVAEVDRLVEIGEEQLLDAIDEVIDVAEAA